MGKQMEKLMKILKDEDLNSILADTALIGVFENLGSEFLNEDIHNIMNEAIDKAKEVCRGL